MHVILQAADLQILNINRKRKNQQGKVKISKEVKISQKKLATAQDFVISSNKLSINLKNEEQILASICENKVSFLRSPSVFLSTLLDTLVQFKFLMVP